MLIYADPMLHNGLFKRGNVIKESFNVQMNKEIIIDLKMQQCFILEYYYPSEIPTAKPTTVISRMHSYAVWYPIAVG